MRQAILKILRPFRRVMMWLTGQSEILRRVESLASHTEALMKQQGETISVGYQLGEKLDRFPGLLDRAGSAVIADEIDRMDGYFVYQLGELRAEIERLRLIVEKRPDARHE